MQLDQQFVVHHCLFIAILGVEYRGQIMVITMSFVLLVFEDLGDL